VHLTDPLDYIEETWIGCGLCARNKHITRSISVIYTFPYSFPFRRAEIKIVTRDIAPAMAIRTPVIAGVTNFPGEFNQARLSCL
jgi:hypothetical protein